jgi:hypothetical protein
MTHQIRGLIVSLLVLAALAAPAVAAQRKRASAQPVAGENAYRSAAGYHAAVMEHCKAINKLARSRASFDVELAREHAAEVSRNLDAASKHMASYLAALGPEQRSQTAAEGSATEAKQAEAKRLGAALAGVLSTAAPDPKQVVSAVTDLYLAERELVTTHKAAGKALGIGLSTAPRKSTPRKRGPKAKTSEAQVGVVTKAAP